MSYKIKLEPNAARVLAAVPNPLKRQVSDGLHALGVDPTGLSKPIQPPANAGQAYEFSFLYDDMECWVAAIFQYHADEQTLHIFDIRWEVL